MVSTNEHREHLVIRRGTRPLSTDIEKYRSIFFVEEGVIVPVSLFVSPFIFLIEVIDLIVEVVSVILIHRHSKMGPSAGASMELNLWWRCRQTTDCGGYQTCNETSFHYI